MASSTGPNDHSRSRRRRSRWRSISRRQNSQTGAETRISRHRRRPHSPIQEKQSDQAPGECEREQRVQHLSKCRELLHAESVEKARQRAARPGSPATSCASLREGRATSVESVSMSLLVVSVGWFSQIVLGSSPGKSFRIVPSLARPSWNRFARTFLIR